MQELKGESVQTGSLFLCAGFILATNMKTLRPFFCAPLWLLLAVLSLNVPAHADSHEAEIQYLIDSIGRDGCRFVRNDRRYSNREARAHLKSKRELNEQYMASAEDFIEKLASYSVTTGEPYRIRCRGGQEQAAGDWFRTLLATFRSGSA